LETNTTGWSGANVTISQSTSYAKYGSNSLKGVVATTGTNRYIDFLNTAVPIISGQTYTYSCWVYLPTTNTADISLTLQAYPWNATGFGAGINLNTQTVTRGTWTRFSGTFTPVNAGGGTPATSCLFRVINTASWAAGQEIYIDGALLEQSNTLGDYFDGSTTIPLGAAWTGTANASSSTLTGIQTPIFTGIISDVEISLDGYGEIGSIARYSVTAVGSLAQLNKRLVGASGYAKEFDGTRVFNILSEAFLTSWLDVNPTLQWVQLPTEVTWATYDATNESLVNALATTVDQPGDYELHQYTDGETNAYELIQQAAQSGRGVLWEGGDGHLHYDDYGHRLNNTSLTLTADDILARGLKTTAQWSEIVNDVTITYKANATERARDEQSVILYGQLAGNRTTQLEEATAAQDQAQSFLTSRSYPRTYPEIITIPLHSPTVSDNTRDALAAVYNGLPVTTSDLPAVFGTTFTGYVEGWTWNLTRYTAELALTCSAFFETYPHLVWFQIPPTTTWAGYTPITDTWQDL
jgi:hypothetical protein